MSLLTECPTDIQNLLAEFVGHPYVIGSEPNSFFFDKANGVTRWTTLGKWCDTLDYEIELHFSPYHWPHQALNYKVTGVDGSSIKIQGYTIKWNGDDDSEDVYVPTGPVLQRVVHETIEEDGFISYWVVLREPVNSGGYGPCFDDEGRFCPMELLVFDGRCSTDRMNEVYFEN